jgi:hypothetical protein
MSEETPKKKRGFATLSPEQHREIASRGGKSAHAAGTAHRWDSDAAREAGKKGGAAPRRKKEASQ